MTAAHHTSLDTDVVIVGAGPVGLMLAGELRLGGAEVTVLERRPVPNAESRATTLHARTMEILDNRALLAELDRPPHEPTGHFGGIPLRMDVPSPWPGQWKVPQPRTEQVLGRWAGRAGARVLRGHEVWDLRQHETLVEIEATGPHGPLVARAGWVVGCDGEDSTVALLAGACYTGQPVRREMLRADVHGIDIPERRFERLPLGLAVAARRPDGQTRVMVHEHGAPPTHADGLDDFPHVCRAWRRVTGEDITHGRPSWVNSFGDASHLARSYRLGRVLLAGDAAHQQMPVGGQALNLGLQDAVNLGWKLALVATGRAEDSLLDTYHDERHDVGAQVLSGIRAQASLLLGGPEVDDLRAVLGTLITQEPVRRRLAGIITGVDLSYAGTTESPHPLEREQPQPGDRLMPTALIADDDTHTSTTMLLRDGRGLLLDLRTRPAHSEPLTAVTAGWTDRVRTVSARAAPGQENLPGTAPPDSLLLVRPDGHIAWMSTPASTTAAARTERTADQLEQALRRWFGGPRPQYPHQSTPRRNQMERLSGKTALVTGASRGIGRGIATRLAADGALVAVHYATGEQEAKETVTEIERDGGRAFPVQAELGVAGDAHQLMLSVAEGLRERVGSAELHILVNNAGVMGHKPIGETTVDDFDRLMAINARAPFFLIQRVLDAMPDGGRIINISSGLTRVANPDELAYAMSKGALEQLARHLAKQVGPRRITVNSVAPGITNNGSPLFDLPEVVEQMAGLSVFQRVGEPPDIADVVAFLASDDARWITGAFLDATGGTLLG